eukprot:INCI6481.1.p1 GENE.INCI6481.1~~INCI6481.1.p1  ORF type:complete len:489 (+),score=77.14 INCI6481.1:159-1625(+)
MDPPRSGVLNKGREYGSIVTAANLENCRLSGDATGSMPTCVHLISYLASTFKHSSQDEWHQKVADGLVEVNGTTCTDEKAAVYVGDSITYQRPPWVEPYFENGGKLPNHLPILFEDQDIVAVHKPSGLPVMPSTVFNECTVMAVLKRQFSKESRDAPRVRTTGSCEGAAISGQIKSSSTTIGTQNCIAPQLRQKRKINTTSPIAGDAQSSQIANSAPPATAVCSKRQRHHDVAGGGAKASQEAPCSSGTTIPSPAHRLGVGTSGVLLCGKTSVGRKMLGGLFDCSGLDEGTANFRKLKPKTLAKIRKKAVARMKKVQKVYLALCEGVIQGGDESEIEIVQPIGPVRYPLPLGSLHAANSSGRSAKSFVKVLSRDPILNQTLAQVRIVTGRPHQIRIHMAWLGYPLVGDPLYQRGGIPRVPDATTGGKVPLPTDTGYHLHAWRVEFDHPGIADGRLRIVADPVPPLLQPTRHDASSGHDSCGDSVLVSH